MQISRIDRLQTEKGLSLPVQFCTVLRTEKTLILFNCWVLGHSTSELSCFFNCVFLICLSCLRLETVTRAEYPDASWGFVVGKTGEKTLKQHSLFQFSFGIKGSDHVLRCIICYHQREAIPFMDPCVQKWRHLFCLSVCLCVHTETVQVRLLECCSSGCGQNIHWSLKGISLACEMAGIGCSENRLQELKRPENFIIVISWYCTPEPF